MASTTTVLVPTGAPEIGSIPIAQRPKSLKGLRVALLDNGKEFSDIVLDALATTLKKRLRRHRHQILAQGFPRQGRAVHRRDGGGV